LITLFLGGARSGKSALAEQLVAGLPEPVTYVATLRLDPATDPATATDPDLLARVRAHQERRPAHWQTIEAGPDLAEVLGRLAGTVLVDSLGPWVAAHPGADAEALCRALHARPGDSVVVSEEVGLGVHPSSEAGRHFRDELGRLNQAVAAVADRVYLVVAGRALALSEWPA
jgi:adenosyl cobinamide kinase/adenosyl cobinamide phosphate guanylyltransferase